MSIIKSKEILDSIEIVDNIIKACEFEPIKSEARIDWDATDLNEICSIHDKLKSSIKFEPIFSELAIFFYTIMIKNSS